MYRAHCRCKGIGISRQIGAAQQTELRLQLQIIQLPSHRKRNVGMNNTRSVSGLAGNTPYQNHRETVKCAEIRGH